MTLSSCCVCEYVCQYVATVTSYLVYFVVDIVLIDFQVTHSMRINEKPLEPWLIVCSDGTVQSAHCTCMAGWSEGCSHIAAVPFALEHGSRISK